MFVDEITELFGGADGDYLMEKLTYKELIARRNARIKRKNKEIEDEQKFREAELKAQQSAAIRNQITR